MKSTLELMLGPVKSKPQHPSPGKVPGHLNFWKKKPVQMPRHKSISCDQMPPPPGKLPDYYLTFHWLLLCF